MDRGVEMRVEPGASAPSSLYRAVAAVGLALGIGVILVIGKDVLVPLALAILLSFALSPIVRTLQRLHIPRAAATLLALVLALTILGLMLWFLSGQLVDLGAQLQNYTNVVHEKLKTLTTPFDGTGRISSFISMLSDSMREIAPNAGAAGGGGDVQHVVVVNDSALARITMLGGYASPLLSPIAVLAIVFVFTAFLLVQREDLRNRFIKLLGPKDIYRTTQAMDEAGRRVGRMLLTQLALNLSFGVCIGVGLWLIGVPNPALWGALAAVARFVPYIGVIAGVAPPLLVAFAFDPGWRSFIETGALFAVAEMFAGQVLEPLLYGHSSGLSPVAVVVSATVWGFIWGPIGLVLATPLTICLVVLGRYAPQLAFLETLLGDAPALEPYEMFYQRMLAGDPDEAYVQARQFLKQGSDAAYFDEIALEALRRASVDVARGDLDDERLEMMKSSVHKLMVELGSSNKLGASARRLFFTRRISKEARAALARSRAMDAGPRLGRASLADSWRGQQPVAVVYGDHPLDSLAGAMLAQAFASRGLGCRLVSLQDGAAVEPAAANETALVCLCFLEPVSLAHLRAIASDARRKCAQAKIILCAWGDGDSPMIAELAGRIRVDTVANSITAAVAAALRFARKSGSEEVGTAPPARALRPNLETTGIG